MDVPPISSTESMLTHSPISTYRLMQRLGGACWRSRSGGGLQTLLPAPARRLASSSATAPTTTSSSTTTTSTTSSPLIDWSQADPALSQDSVRLLPDVITAKEERSLVQELEKPLRRRRLMQNHWDSVIEHYREVEKRGWEDQMNAEVIKRVCGKVLELLGLAPDLPCLPVHVIDLAAEGFIKPHVDSVKFSGGFVAGISLLSPAIMRLRGEEGEAPTSSMVRMLLEPRSLYILSGDARYRYAHEILPDGEEEDWVGGQAVKRGRRISLIFRDELLVDGSRPPPSSHGRRMGMGGGGQM